MTTNRTRIREAFEAWVLTPSLALNDPEGYGGNRTQLEKDGDGPYRLPDIQSMWLAWQAAHRLAMRRPDHR